MGRSSLGFIVVFAGACVVDACGRQVTPNPPGLGAGGAPPGYLAAYFTVAAPLNFTTYQYMFVFNTAGTGRTPSTDTAQTNWAGYSFALVALGSGAGAYGEAVQFVPSRVAHEPPAWLVLHPTPQQLTFNANANGMNTEFSFLTKDVIFKGYATPGPSPSPSATPTPPFLYNAFVTQTGASGGGQWYFRDSMGQGGPNDPQYVSPSLCMTEPFDNTYYAADHYVSDPSAQIVSVELANNPASPSPCP